MSVNYSFKHHFNWPLPSAPSGPIPAAAAAPLGAIPGYIHPPLHPVQYAGYGHGRGGRMFRPRFGLFRRFFWFGLGVGAASWYIHKKQAKHLHMIEQGDIDLPPAEAGQGGDRRNRWPGSWREGHNRHHHSAIPNPSEPMAQAIPVSFIPTTQPTPTDQPSSTPATPAHHAGAADDIAALRSTVDKLISEKTREMGELQVKARHEAKEYAREKLDRLSVILEGLKENLSKDDTGKGKKLV